MIDFALWVGIGATLGLWRVARSATRQTGVWVNLGLFVLLAALIGSRISYIYMNRSYYADHPLEATMLWLGGLTWPGAIIGAAVAIFYLAILYRSRRTGRVSVGWIGDRLYPLLLPLAVTSWLGCWTVGCGYGPVLPAETWYGIPTIDETGTVALRLPVQFMAAVSLLIYFGILEALVQPLRPAGRLSSFAILGLLLHLLVFSFLTADPSPYWNGLRIDSWAAMIYIMLFLSFLVFNGFITRLSRRLRQKITYSS